jgi:hypothetical protein
MNPVIVKAIVSILTLVTVVASVYFTVLGITIAQPMLAVACGLLTLGFGYFTFNDVKYWIQLFSTKK